MWPFLHVEQQVTVYLQVSYLCAVWFILLQKLPEHLSEMAKDSIQNDNQHTETDEFITTQQDIPGGITGTIKIPRWQAPLAISQNTYLQIEL